MNQLEAFGRPPPSFRVVFSPVTALNDVWGYKPGVSTRTIDTHVKRLRDKLGSAGALIETVRGTGYRLSGEHQVVAKD